MPLSIPATNATKANFADALKTFVDGLETSVGTAQTTANAANVLAGQKYTKPAAGIPSSDLDSSAQALLGNVRVRRYIALAWEPRGTTSTAVTVLWLKPLAADPDPPINATHFLAGTDVLIKASA